MNYPRMFLAAFAATLAMTGFILLAPIIGLPKMDIGGILAGVFNGNRAVGWGLHFLIGLCFAIPYPLMFNYWIPVENRIARGAIYGIVVFIVSEIILTGANMSGHLQWEQKEGLGLLVFGNCIACLIYGSVLGAFFERKGADIMEDAKRVA